MQKARIMIFMATKIFITINIFVAPLLNISKKTYTFIYITKILTNFGLLPPVNKKYGYL